jgi:pyruvate dehydrogenase E1 component beta subunit
MRKMTYAQAVNEALRQLLRTDERVFLIGQGVVSPWYVGTTTVGLLEEFGERRVIDTPVSENGVTGAGIGAAIAGMCPIIVHPRMDFMYNAMDQIVNHAANWFSMFGRQVNVPLVIWGIVNRGGEQAAQHSQALQAVFTHVPGLKVVMPATPYDAKGLLISAVRDKNPVIFIDDRWLYGLEDDVPEDMYEVPIGRAMIRKHGEDITVMATSTMVSQALRGAADLAKEGIDAEVVDVRTIKPLDRNLLLASVEKTGRLVVADGGWRTCGVAAEISSLVFEESFGTMRAPVVRVTLPDAPAPASSVLERSYYPGSQEIVEAVKRVLR